MWKSTGKTVAHYKHFLFTELFKKRLLWKPFIWAENKTAAFKHFLVSPLETFAFRLSNLFLDSLRKKQTNKQKKNKGLIFFLGVSTEMERNGPVFCSVFCGSSVCIILYRLHLRVKTSSEILQLNSACWYLHKRWHNSWCLLFLPHWKYYKSDVF